MRFGAHYLPTYIPDLDGPVPDFYQRLFQQINLAESLGFHDAWITEHHFDEFGGIVPDPAGFLAAAAGHTSTIRLGIAVVVLPLRDPVQVAETYAMVDVASNGRLEFGVARGSTPQEFDSLHIAYAQSGPRLREGMEVIEQAWSGKPVTFHGQMYDIENVRVLPRPVQTPHPPVWVAASRSDDTYRWAGSKGYNLMVLPNAAEPPALQQAVKTYREALKNAGHSKPTETLAKFLIYVAGSDATAREEASRFMANYWAVADRRNPTGPGRGGERSFDAQQTKGTIIAGDPSRCVDMIRFWVETLGLTAVSGSFHFGGMPQEQAYGNLRLFAEKVMPAFSSPVRD